MRRRKWPNLTIAGAALSVALGAVIGAPVTAEQSLDAERVPARVEPVSGTEVSRVILTPRAAERLDIQTARVTEVLIERWRALGGEVVAMDELGEAAAIPVIATTGGDATGSVPPNTPVHAGALSIRVQRHPDLMVFAPQQLITVRVVVEDDDNDSLELSATLVDDGEGSGGAGSAPLGSTDDTSLLYLATVPAGSGVELAPGYPVQVKVPWRDQGMLSKAIPYSALIYDTEGRTWVYVIEEPLVFVRHEVTVDFIESGIATLLDGPAIGTEVVSVGAVELLGTEFEIGH